MPKGSEIKSGKETVESIKKKVLANSGGGKCIKEKCCTKKADQWRAVLLY